MKPMNLAAPKRNGVGITVTTFVALLMLVSCGPQYSDDSTKDAANLSDLAVRDLWVEDFNDASLSTIVSQSSRVPPNTTKAPCHAKITIPADERIPYPELRNALVNYVDPSPTFYNKAYMHEVPLSAEHASLLTTYDRRADWLIQQSVIVSRYIELRLVDELLVSFQRTLARYDRLLENIEYWKDQKALPEEFISDIEIIRTFSAASRPLPAQLASVKANCFKILGEATGLRERVIDQIIDNTWTQQPAPLPGISPFVPAQLLNKRPDIAYVQDVITQAPILDGNSEIYSFGLSGTISSTGVDLSSQPLAKAALKITGDESYAELLRKQEIFMLVETWGKVAARASEDVSNALGKYEVLSKEIYQVEQKIKKSEEAVSKSFAQFDSGRPIPKNIILYIRDIQRHEIKIAGMRAEYAKLWAFLNVALGHGRSAP